MVPGDWSKLPEQLNKPADVEKGIDAVLNGYELRADLAQRFGVSRAYYAYGLCLVVRKDQTAVRLGRPGRAAGRGAERVGGAEYVRDAHPAAKLETNEDVANVFQLVADNRLPATVQDNAAAAYYVGQDARLKLAGEPARGGYYVLYYRKSDVDLGAKLDAAIADGLRDGTFRRIYEKYGLWNADQAEVVALLDRPWPPADLAAPDAAGLWRRLFGELLDAAGRTLQLAFGSFPLAMASGLLVAVGRVYGAWWLRVPLGVYVEVIRGTPLLLQLFVVFYMLPVVAERLLPGAAGYFTPFACGIVGLAVNYSAYEAENYRAGLLAVPRGQMEAALALGMSPGTAVRRVVVPQAVRVVIPPVTNDFIALFKDTSVCSVILITELTRKYNELFNFHRDKVVELVFVTAALYLLMSYPLAVLAGFLERRYAVGAGGRP